MTLRSAIYEGHVRHRRWKPAREFTFSLFMVYLDLAELDRVLSMTRLWSRSRWSPARFRREDYLAPHDVSLDEAVRRRVHDALGRRPTGPIRMLTHLRYLGYIFNPVTFYYCFDECDRVTAIVAEITNTPWGERHAYVLDADRLPHAGPARAMRWRFGKEFHVSPFLPLDMEYDWTFTPPHESLFVHMNVRDDRASPHRVFDATLLLKRHALTPMSMRTVLLRHPLMTAHVIFKIHLEALRLWLGRAPVYPHPSKSPPSVTIDPQGARP